MSNSIISANILLWRQKAREGTLTLDEMRQSIAAIRKPRSEAAEVSAASKVKKAAAKVKAAPINVDDLFSRLGIKPEDVQEPDTSTDTDTDSDSDSEYFPSTQANTTTKANHDNQANRLFLRPCHRTSD